MRTSILKPAKNSFFQPVLRRKCVCGGDAGPTGECTECRKKRDPLRRHALTRAEPGAVPEIVQEVLQGSGEPLDAESRSYMEPRFNRDFSAVRIHRGPMAAEAAESVQAAAFTIGRDVVFSDHYYQPQTPLGRYLLAHELAHTVQQGSARWGGAGAVGRSSDPAEAQADNVAAQVAFGGDGRPGLSTNSGLALARIDCASLSMKACRAGVYKCGYQNTGTCGWVGPARGCICTGSLKPTPPEKVPEKVPEKAPEPAKQRVRPIGVDPDFRDFANRLPAFEAQEGREFIIVIADDIYQGFTSAAQQIRNEQYRRATRVDPHNIPVLQINPALLPVAIVIGVAEGGILLALAAPTIVAAGAAIAEFVVSSAAAATEAIGSRAALSWAVTRITQAGAMALVPKLIDGGMSFADSVVAVQPLANKRVTGMADITGNSLEGATGGQAVTIGGETYRTIMRLTSRKF